MKQFLLGAGSAMLLAAGGVAWWTSDHAQADSPIPPRPAGAAVMPLIEAALPEPPAATAKTREEKRFGRYDKDKNGAISRDEYLSSRQKAFAKLDTNGDGRLQLEIPGIQRLPCQDLLGAVADKRRRNHLRDAG